VQQNKESCGTGQSVLRWFGIRGSAEGTAVRLLVVVSLNVNASDEAAGDTAHCEAQGPKRYRSGLFAVLLPVRTTGRAPARRPAGLRPPDVPPVHMATPPVLAEDSLAPQLICLWHC
jgi:hypothetical protein